MRNAEGAVGCWQGRSGGELCAWVPTTNSQRMRKLVVVEDEDEDETAQRSSHRGAFVSTTRQTLTPFPALLLLLTSTPSFVWLALSAHSCCPRPCLPVLPSPLFPSLLGYYAFLLCSAPTLFNFALLSVVAFVVSSVVIPFVVILLLVVAFS